MQRRRRYARKFRMEDQIEHKLRKIIITILEVVLFTPKQSNHFEVASRTTKNVYCNRDGKNRYVNEFKLLAAISKQPKELAAVCLQISRTLHNYL